MFVPKQNAEGSSVKESGAGGGVKAMDDDLKNEIQKIVMGIVKDAIPRAMQQSMSTVIPSMLDRMAEEALKGDATTPVITPTVEGKPTLKTLDSKWEEKYKALENAFKASQQETKQAQEKARDARLRAEFQSKLAAKIGADNPLLSTLMDSLYDVKKRVTEGPNGQPAIKFIDTWGNEELKPLDEGMATMFENELKPFLPSPTAKLPPNGFNMRPQGSPLKPNMGQSPNQRVNPLLQAIAEGVADTRPEAAQIIMNDAVNIAAPSPRK